MLKNSVIPEKPHSDVLRPELTRLPDLDAARLEYRRKTAVWCRRVVRWLTRASVHGLENFPRTGPGLIAVNHLGDLDAVLGLAALPVQAEALGKVELYDHRLVGRPLDRYGIIWVHRGTPDRRAIRAALAGLAQGRFVGIAPEGRQSLTGALEEGTGGAAYLALKAAVPVIPITFVGTEDSNVYPNLRRLRRPVVSITIGKPFHLEEMEDFRAAVEAGTEKIMLALAAQLPEKYRGAYAGGSNKSHP